MKHRWAACWFLLSVAAQVVAQTPSPRGPFGAAEWKASAIPLRPGEPGRAPFWNAHAHRFIFAPAFNFPKVDGAVRYRFELTSAKHGETCRFENEVPWTPLSPIWASVPPGNFSLKVTGLSAQGGGRRRRRRREIFPRRAVRRTVSRTVDALRSERRARARSGDAQTLRRILAEA